MKKIWCFSCILFGIVILFSNCKRSKTLEVLAAEKQTYILKEDIDYFMKIYGVSVPIPTQQQLDKERSITLDNTRSWLENNLLDTSDILDFVLPHLVNDATDSLWRWQVRERFKNVKIPKGKITMEDFLHFCNKISDSVKKDMAFGKNKVNESQLTFNELKEKGKGNCVSMTDYANYTFRAFGIPVTTEFIPVWGNLNSQGHAWNRLLLKGKSIPFMGAESNVGNYSPITISVKSDGSPATKRLPPKVYRTARYTSESMTFFGKKVLDVTDEYVPVNTIAFEIDDNNVLPIYLATYNNGQFNIVSTGEVDSSKITFRKMGTGLIYFPVTMDKAKPIPVGNPVVCKKNGSIIKITSQTKKINFSIDHLLSLEQGQMYYLAKHGYDGLDKIDFQNKYDVCPLPVNEHNYELYYWESGWKKHSSAIAKAKCLRFSDVPDNSVYIVKETGSNFRETRPFIISSGKVNWF